MAALNDRLEFALGRKFRYLILNGTHNIRLITIGHEENAIDVLPNDPLFLMKPNLVLGNSNNPEFICPRYNTNCSEPLFAPYQDELGTLDANGETQISFNYVDKRSGEVKSSNVILRFSKVRAEFYDQTAIPSGDPGRKEIGQFAKKLEGISVVRAGREIDFGVFDFYDKTNNPYHRWWGCEIRFEPVLDELFGVANNKQQVELHRDIADTEGEESLWERLDNYINGTIKQMVEANKVLRKGSRSSKEGADGSESENIISAVEDTLDDHGSATEEVRNTATQEELEDSARNELIEQGIEDPTHEQIHAFLEQEVSIIYSNLTRLGNFLDVDFSVGKVILRINTAHIFYDEFIAKMPEESKVAFELFVAALAKALGLV